MNKKLLALTLSGALAVSMLAAELPTEETPLHLQTRRQIPQKQAEQKALYTI